MSNENNESKVICRCLGITEETILEAIKGAQALTTVEMLKEIGPGTGKCKGGYCRPRITEILERELG